MFLRWIRITVSCGPDAGTRAETFWWFFMPEHIRLEFRREQEEQIQERNNISRRTERSGQEESDEFVLKIRSTLSVT